MVGNIFNKCITVYSFQCCLFRWIPRRNRRSGEDGITNGHAGLLNSKLDSVRDPPQHRRICTIEVRHLKLELPDVVIIMVCIINTVDDK